MGSSAGKNKKRFNHQPSDTSDSSMSSDQKLSNEDQNNNCIPEKIENHTDNDNDELMWDDEEEEFIIPDKIELKKICKETQKEVDQTIQRLKELKIFEKVHNWKIKPPRPQLKRNNSKNIHISRIRKIPHPEKVSQNQVKLPLIKSTETEQQVQRQFNPYKKHRTAILRTADHKNAQEVNENWIEKQNKALLEIQRKNKQKTLSARRNNQLSFLKQIRQNKSNQFILPRINSPTNQMYPNQLKQN